MTKKRKNLIAVLGILSALFISAGATYAFFSYAQEGSTENTIKSGSITFLYDEINQSGNSIGIVDALPTSDTDGKAQTQAFNFKITSTTASNIAIPYEITLRQKAGTDDIGNIVKVYLAKTTGYDAAINTEQQVELSLFSSLAGTTHNGYSEKTLYTEEVPKNTANYEQNYRLKMWLDSSVDYSDGTLNNKTFTVMVNVYANGRIASSNANIQSVAVNNTVLTPVNANEYETTLEPETTQATVAIETEDDNSTVEITKTQSDYTTPITEANSIQRLANTVNRTLPVSEGDNYFKIVVTSENNRNTKEQHLKITVPAAGVVLKDKILSDNTLKSSIPDFSYPEPYTVLSYTDLGFPSTTDLAIRYSGRENYYYTYASSYTFDTTTGKYTLVNPQVCQYSNCYETLKNKYIVSNGGSSNNTAAKSNDLFNIYKVTTESTSSILSYIQNLTPAVNYDNSLKGLYSMNVTNGYGGQDGTTYYFRGAVDNNYVKFAKWDSSVYYGFAQGSTSSPRIYTSMIECMSDSYYHYSCTKIHDAGDYIMWRIVRINEDGTMRLVSEDTISKNSTAFSTTNTKNDVSLMYYSNLQVKNAVETWYSTNIKNPYLCKVASGNYFCEAAKVAYSSSSGGNATMTGYMNYTPDLKCETDGNNHGLLNNTVGTLTYDEIIIAGGSSNGYHGRSVGYYLHNFDGIRNSVGTRLMTMSPSGISNFNGYASVWTIQPGDGFVTSNPTAQTYGGGLVRVVINLKADVLATGTGTAADPYVIH